MQTPDLLRQLLRGKKTREVTVSVAVDNRAEQASCLQLVESHADLHVGQQWLIAAGLQIFLFEQVTSRPNSDLIPTNRGKALVRSQFPKDSGPNPEFALREPALLLAPAATQFSERARVGNDWTWSPWHSVELFEGGLAIRATKTKAKKVNRFLVFRKQIPRNRLQLIRLVAPRVPGSV